MVPRQRLLSWNNHRLWYLHCTQCRCSMQWNHMKKPIAQASPISYLIHGGRPTDIKSPMLINPSGTPSCTTVTSPTTTVALPRAGATKCKNYARWPSSSRWNGSPGAGSWQTIPHRLLAATGSQPWWSLEEAEVAVAGSPRPGTPRTIGVVTSSTGCFERLFGGGRNGVASTGGRARERREMERWRQRGPLPPAPSR